MNQLKILRIIEFSVTIFKKLNMRNLLNCILVLLVVFAIFLDNIFENLLQKKDICGIDLTPAHYHILPFSIRLGGQIINTYEYNEYKSRLSESIEYTFRKELNLSDEFFQQARLQYFIKNKLDRYPEDKNDPNLNCVSEMSPYLHFGQISPIFIALKIIESKSIGINSYLEELIVRRELSMNYVFYNKNYDSFYGLPNWSKHTLINHSKDKRDYVYSIEDLEKFDTHDPYWNACQKQMMKNGKMHGYMRMYWGKKIIEWTKDPINAYNNALYLNNKYELDGRDPNAFTGIAWCFGKHDRPWIERSIFGKIRYMNDKGLKRKFDIDKFVNSYK